MHGEDNLNDHYKYANEKGSHVHTKSLCTARLREVTETKFSYDKIPMSTSSTD